MDLPLPDAFCDLDRFVGRWSLPTQNQREAARRATTAEDRKEFYDAAVPRLAAIIDYLNRFPLDSMPEDARRLLHLALSVTEIAPSVELYKGSATVPFSFEETRFIAVHGDRKD
jgi:hypothetical protein